MHETLETQLPSRRGFGLSPEWLANWWIPPGGKKQEDVLSNLQETRLELCMHTRRS